MNDADYIELIARSHEAEEIWYRNQGMFEVAQYFQWSAERVRARQPSLSTRGCGGTSLRAFISDGLVHATGDMDDEEVTTLADYLLQPELDPETQELIQSTDHLIQETSKLTGQMVALIAQFNVSRSKP